MAGNTLPSRIESVTLFRNGAQLVRKANLTLKQGENTVVLGDLPAGFDVASIRVSLSGKSVINGVSYRDNHIQDFSASPEYASLQKQLKTLQEKAEMSNWSMIPGRRGRTDPGQKNWGWNYRRYCSPIDSHGWYTGFVCWKSSKIIGQQTKTGKKITKKLAKSRRKSMNGPNPMQIVIRVR